MVNIIKKTTIFAAVFYIIGLGIGFTFNPEPENIKIYLLGAVFFGLIDLLVILLKIKYIKNMLIYWITGLTFLF